ncbi:coenzyme PQQ synthesis protein D (PqqD) [Marinilabilia salmonicolor]|jgi:methyltransferase-like protein|uniref:PqqD family protein n=1 Tax=Marinilabilia salmonicolor TaxID=989 RepID=UPI000D04EC45|nr:PqqD family protein [Marinilabilia salmonicolor]PRZ00678.1 coenzyme PQQ synthesis protein D (PqqD) [Marinilabilia salmonicolor]
MSEEQQEIRYRVNGADFVTRQMGNEMVMVPLTDKVADMTSVLTLNEVGADILRLLETPQTKEELIRQMLDLYDVDESTLIEDVEAFIAEATQKNVIEIIQP